MTILKNTNTNRSIQTSEGVLFLLFILEIEHLQAIDLSLTEQSPLNSLFILKAMANMYKQY